MMRNLNRSCFFVVCCVVLFALGATTAQAVPVNDNFIDATTISGSTGTVSGNNIDATWENGTLIYPDSITPECKSIWYEWSPPSPGVYYFNTFGSTFDTIIGIYTGTAVDSLTWVNDNDDYPLPSRSQSRLYFTAVSETTYRIVVDSYTPGGSCVSETPDGYVALNWGPSSLLPSNDDFESATVISGDTGTTAGTNINATPEVGEPNHITASLAYSSVWFVWTAPSSGLFVFDTFGSDYDTTMAAYTGAAINALTPVAENDDAGTDLQSRITFSAVAGTIYHIAIDGFGGLQGNVTLNWQALPSLPPNDAFASATSISGKTGTANAYNFLATPETGEPYHGDDTGPYASIWFMWTAPYTGKANFDTFGSDYDTTMAVYTGTAVDSLTKLAENDDAGTGVQSSVTFPVATGTIYYIAVDGFEDSQGNVILNWKKVFPWVMFVPTTLGDFQP